MPQNEMTEHEKYSRETDALIAVSAAIRLVQQVASAHGWAISYNPDTDYFAVIEGGIGVGRATGRSGHPARALLMALNEAQRMGFVRSRLNGGH